KVGTAVIKVSFFESVVRDHSKDPPGGRAYVEGTRSLRSVVHHSAGLHWSYRVLLDGEEVASLKNGRAVTLDVPPGEHRLEVEIAFMNAVLDFAMTDKPKRVLVGRGLAAGGNAFTPPIIVEA
ncbi:hypothetical protein, partial [Dermacoccus nishinomiyaensis]|uniref:hypothetical protein n=1 Tax=Dermacoccus nishinomiyaensis TaxID=1274 RepID=UPI001EF7501C